MLKSCIYCLTGSLIQDLEDLKVLAKFKKRNNGNALTEKI